MATTCSRRSASHRVVIDPKPLVGEREFAVAPIVRSFELGERRRDVLYRLHRLTGELGLDRARARGWTIAQTVTSNSRIPRTPSGMCRSRAGCWMPSDGNRRFARRRQSPRVRRAVVTGAQALSGQSSSGRKMCAAAHALQIGMAESKSSRGIGTFRSGYRHSTS